MVEGDTFKMGFTDGWYPGKDYSVKQSACFLVEPPGMIDQ